MGRHSPRVIASSLFLVLVCAMARTPAIAQNTVRTSVPGAQEMTNPDLGSPAQQRHLVLLKGLKRQLKVWVSALEVGDTSPPDPATARTRLLAARQLEERLLAFEDGGSLPPAIIKIRHVIGWLARRLISLPSGVTELDLEWWTSTDGVTEALARVAARRRQSSETLAEMLGSVCGEEPVDRPLRRSGMVPSGAAGSKSQTSGRSGRGP